MKSCELCKSTARIYCDSDQASLCWTCDTKVHSANFLVARHSRTLLCRTCQSPTPWSASGQTLSPSTASVCQKCYSGNETISSENNGDVTFEDDDVTDENNEIEDENDDDDEEEEESDDNQVVPLCLTPPPPASSSGSDDDELFHVCIKRKRENARDPFSYEDEIECSSPNKVRTLSESKPSSSEAIVEKMKRFRHRETISGENESEGVGLDLNLNL